MVRNLRQPDFATNSSYGRPFRRRLRRGKARSVCLLPFIDDFLFLARSRQLALRLWAEVERVWGRLGLAKHPTKAHPEPTQQLQHLGPDLDLVVLTRKLIRDLEWWRDVPTRHNGAPILRPVETA
eukprot:jgi/Tetstr1/446645/TSEL_034166.t2